MRLLGNDKAVGCHWREDYLDKDPFSARPGAQPVSQSHASVFYVALCWKTTQTAESAWAMVEINVFEFWFCHYWLWALGNSSRLCLHFLTCKTDMLHKTAVRISKLWEDMQAICVIAGA